MPTRPAPMPKASTYVRFTSTPMSAAAARFCASARKARPVWVEVRNRCIAAATARATTKVTTCPLTKVSGPSARFWLPSANSALRMSAPNTISARFSNAVDTPTVAKIWMCASADSSGWMISRCITAPSTNSSSTTSGTATYGCRPIWWAQSQAAYMPTIRNSPWAKLTTRTTPKIRVRPMLMMAYAPPSSRPLASS